MVFDCPDASAAVAERTRSNTPLQALTLLNGETCLDAARGLARQVHVAELENDHSAVRAMFRACLTRPPDERELARVARLHQDHRSWYRSREQEAQALTVEDLPAGATLPEMAALIATANVIMNLDEFITRE
jgi:hypothetical protein